MPGQRCYYTPHHPTICCVAFTMRARSTRCYYTPHHPTICCVASTMRARSKLQVQGTSPAQPHPMTCVASTMCASARNVIMPTPPHDLRSIDHVCKCKERHHPTPPQPHAWRTAQTCAPTRAVFDPVAKTWHHRSTPWKFPGCKVRVWGHAADMSLTSGGVYIQDQGGRWMRSTVVRPVCDPAIDDHDPGSCPVDNRLSENEPAPQLCQEEKPASWRSRR